MTLEDIELIERHIAAGDDLDEVLKRLPHLSIKDVIEELYRLKLDECGV